MIYISTIQDFSDIKFTTMEDVVLLGFYFQENKIDHFQSHYNMRSEKNYNSVFKNTIIFIVGCNYDHFLRIKLNWSFIL